ncbi:MAG: ferritin-like domain-containing protein [Agriterribacter sp.]
MNTAYIINALESVDPDIHERISPRRQALKSFAGFTGKLALTAIPIALGGLFKKAYGQTPSKVIDVLNYALTLEYLEAAFYDKGVKSADLKIPTAVGRKAIEDIGKHEAEHVAFLTTAIKSSGGTPVKSPNFDFSAGSGSGNGPFKDVFKSYALFLAVAQAFEDTGVRAYKGQAGNLKGTGAVLTAALNIHSVEARHASTIRQMRQSNGFGNVKPWITGKDTGGIGAAVEANYMGEENTMQAGIQIVGINGMDISADAASEAFDEPLTMDEVVKLVTPFFAP